MKTGFRRTKKHEYSTKYRELVKVKKCVRCGYEENKGSLQVHHLDKNHCNNSRQNLIVLCANCHFGLHQGKWKLEDIGLKTRSKQHNISKKKSMRCEIVDIHKEIETINGTIQNISVSKVSEKYEYLTVKNPRYIVRSAELRLYLDDVRILTMSEYDAIVFDIKKSSIQAIFDIMIITGINYEELTQLHQFHGLYKPSSNTITVLRSDQEKDIRVGVTFGYLLNAFWKRSSIPSEKALNRILQVYASKKDITPYGITLASLRKSYEVWMLNSGTPEIEIFGEKGHDPVTSLRHYQSLSFTDYELRDIKKRLTEWGILRD